jgi:serine/threonine protein kinase
MGVVYRARDTRLDRAVAVKVLSDSVVDSKERARFRREAKILAGLQHQNICALYDIGSEGDTDYELAMRYLKRGVELRLPEMIGIRADPVLRSVRNHPEFSGLLDAIGLRRNEPPSPDESRTVASTVS